MPHIVSQFIAFVQLVIPYWPILVAVIAAVGAWKLYKLWKRQHEDQQMPSFRLIPKLCDCGLPDGHYGGHLGTSCD